MIGTHAESSSKNRFPCAQRVAQVCLALLLTAALGCSEEKQRPQGLLDAEGKPVGNVAPNRAATPESSPVERPPEALPSPFGDGQQEGEVAVAAAAAEPEPEEKRDLAAELKALIGQPTSCLDLDKVANGGGSVTIRVTASVAPSGRINRATVSATGQASEALRCIERLVLNGSLEGPIENAPLSVSAENVVEAVRVAPTKAPQAVEQARPAPATIAQPADGVELAAPADDVELAAPPEDDEPVELAQPAD
jgi:hypothetical protein